MIYAYWESEEGKWERVSPDQFRRLRNISAPNSALADLGLRQVVEAPKPQVSEMQYLRRGPIVDVDGVPTRQWNVVDLTLDEIAERLAVAKVTAKAAMLDWINAFLSRFTENLPDAEPTVWGVKEVAALAYMGGMPTARQRKMIEEEASVSGENPSQLANEVAQNGELYFDVIAFATGLRRKTEDAIDAAATAQEIPALLADAKSEALNKANELGL